MENNVQIKEKPPVTILFLAQLFWSTFVISLMTVGGGYVMVSIMQKSFVEKKKWIEEEEMLDIVAISTSCPGAIAINSSIIIGYKMAGIRGAIVTLLGTIMPPLCIAMIVAVMYEAFNENYVIRLFLDGMRIGVAAVIIDVVIGMVSGIIKKKSVLGVIILISAFIAVAFFSVNVIIVIVISGIIGAMTLLRKGV